MSDEFKIVPHKHHCPIKLTTQDEENSEHIGLLNADGTVEGDLEKLTKQNEQGNIDGISQTLFCMFTALLRQQNRIEQLEQKFNDLMRRY